jgi:hypothetical protein
MQATDAELKEVMAIAMTVGATKIRMLHENALASLAQEKPARIQGTGEKNTLSESEACPA